MKSQCHCGLKEHFLHFRAKRLGIFGIFLMGLHILFHIVECLVLPALLVGLGNQVNAVSEKENIEIQEQVSPVFDNLWQEHSLSDSTILIRFDQSLLK